MGIPIALYLLSVVYTIEQLRKDDNYINEVKRLSGLVVIKLWQTALIVTVILLLLSPYLLIKRLYNEMQRMFRAD